jgi:hypothetical protein
MKDSELTKKYGPQPERKTPHKEYPKAMYRVVPKSDPPVEEVLAVEDEDAEKEAKKQGWKNHGETGGKK